MMRRSTTIRLVSAAVLGLSLLSLAACSRPAPTPDSWIGRRVITAHDTVPKVGGPVVDDEIVSINLALSWRDRRLFHIYRVQQTKGRWLWLVAEKEGMSGWVKTADVIPFDQAIDYLTAEIQANPGSSGDYSNRGFIWHAKGEHDSAFADYNEAIRLNPKNTSAYNGRGKTWSGKKEYDKAIADYAVAIRLGPNDAGAYSNRAWLLATCPDAKFRDGVRAIESATRACELSRWKDGSTLDTLAAACAEAGDFDAAVRWQEKGMLTNPEAREAYRTRLNLYRAKKPYRETSP
jgi:hypothetical protein